MFCTHSDPLIFVLKALFSVVSFLHSQQINHVKAKEATKLNINWICYSEMVYLHWVVGLIIESDYSYREM